ncbi:MAG: 60S ribosomal export protein NMD3 [Thermoplasmata archaeon]|nr:60S ribosomal export protein NMD3 [Thermoplasmata archaeon]MCI4338414.1 60S ribosomal export protein NMD3 [Thermoplasmata archaeon]MCI4341894.1 60S ribosomal export protein NMD3 [Thermoplasmata archaeon]
MAEFCVVCGRTGLPLEEGVCTDCFVAKNPLVTVRARPGVVLCPECGARKVGEAWERRGAPPLLSLEDLRPLLVAREGVGIRRANFEEGGKQRLVRELRGSVDVRFRDTERSVPLSFEVRVEHRTCTNCSRRSGGFYTAVIQLRGPEGRRRMKANALREALRVRWDALIPLTRTDWREALSWFEPLKEGWDFYLTDTESARSLARWMRGRLGATLTESPSLWGRKDGREVYRVTFCLRVPLADTPSGGSESPPAPVEEKPLQIERQA